MAEGSESADLMRLKKYEFSEILINTAYVIDMQITKNERDQLKAHLKKSSDTELSAHFNNVTVAQSSNHKLFTHALPI